MFYISYNFSSPHFNLLRVARRCFSWSSVSDDLFFSSCSCLVLLLVLSFLHLILSFSFLCSSVSGALFALSFSILGERCFFRLLFFVHAKAALVNFNWPKLTLSMRVFGSRNSAHAFWHTYFLYGFPVDKPTYIHTYIHIYISCEISIEQPSVGLASLAQLC